MTSIILPVAFVAFLVELWVVVQVPVLWGWLQGCPSVCVGTPFAHVL